LSLEDIIAELPMRATSHAIDGDDTPDQAQRQDL
jgi:hypothetical protein